MRPGRRPFQERRSRGKAAAGRRQDDAVRLYGRHAVSAALANPRRRAIRLYATPRALAELRAGNAALRLPGEVKLVGPAELAQLVGEDVPHQGCVLDAQPLAPAPLTTFACDRDARARLVVLDRVEDPRNLGAIMRTALLLGARGIVTTERHAPRESGALARAAAGALDRLPWARVPNLARALDELAEMGYWRVGLDTGGDAEPIGAVARERPLALVLGAEGKGLRRLTARKLDWKVAIPMPGADPLIDSLNVSVAAGIALWALRADASA